MEHRWWGSFGLERDQELGWRIGPLKLWVFRGATEWRITTEPVNDPLDTHLVVATSAAEAAGEDAETLRVGFEATNSELELRPVCADRPVIVKSESPFCVAPEGSATVFVTSPVWVQIRVGRRKELLAEFPTYRPSDSWFGPSTLEGELCYSARTGARLHLDNLPIHPHRAVSVVKIRNEADKLLPLERIRLPLPHLSLYSSEDNRLWTEQLTLVREEVGEMARISLSKGAPKQAGGAKRIADSRLKPEKGLLLRSFGGLRALTGGFRNE